MARPGRDFYSILGVPRTANEKELKKAYRKLAMKWHPDKNLSNKEKAESKFKDINEAYSILNDADKRAVFDKYGEQGLEAGFSGNDPQSSGHSQHFRYESPEDIFSHFFGGSQGGFNSNSNSNSQRFYFNGNNPMHEMASGMNGMSFEEKPSMFDFQNQNPNPQDIPSRRHTRKRKAVEKELFVTMEDIFHGTKKKMKVNRRAQHGGKEDVILELDVKRGMKQGTKFSFKQKGDYEPNGLTADIVFTLKEKKHEKFERENGFDLVQTVKVSLEQAMQSSFKVKVPTIEGASQMVWVNALRGCKHRVKVPGKGLFNRKTGERGDMFLEFNILLPQNKEVRREVATVLGRSNEVIDIS